MKIGIVTTWFERGAAYVSKQFRDVLLLENEVIIYARGGEEYAKGDPNWDHDYVTWGEKANTYAPTDIDLENFSQWLKTNNIELVIFNEQQIWAPVLLCRELGIKTGAYIDYYNEQTVPMFGVYDFLICNTKKHFSAFEWHPQCFYFPWGTDVSVFLPENLSNVTAKEVTFFHSAGMSPFRKGTDLLIKAFSELESDKAKLVIHSQVVLEEIFPELIDIISTLKSDNKLDLHQGSVTAPGLYHKGDVYVYPSRLEGIGLTILEACSVGLPLVVPDYGPMNEFVTPNENGQVVKVSRLWSRADGYYWPQCEVDLSSLKNQLNYYIEQVDNLSELKNKARDYALANFDWSQNAQGLLSTVKEVNFLSEKIIKSARNKARNNDVIMSKRYAIPLKDKIFQSLNQNFPAVYQFSRSVFRKFTS